MRIGTRLRGALAVAAITGGAVAARAAAVMPVAYDMPNGETGTYTYYDDTYTGSGNRNATLASLSGGLGDLTDGAFATGHWYQVSGVPYVGWYSISPTITFHFAGPIAFDSVTFYFDNTTDNVRGGVVAPADWSVSDGTHSATYTSTSADFATIAPNLAETLGLASFTGDTLSVTLNPVAGGRYVMVSEVTFAGSAVGSAVPEPASWAMMVMGFAAVGAALRRRRSLALA